jgi:hypothetical protein
MIKINKWLLKEVLNATLRFMENNADVLITISGYSIMFTATKYFCDYSSEFKLTVMQLNGIRGIVVFESDSNGILELVNELNKCNNSIVTLNRSTVDKNKLIVAEVGK